jgi:hypothetical protein
MTRDYINTTTALLPNGQRDTPYTYLSFPDSFIYICMIHNNLVSKDSTFFTIDKYHDRTRARLKARARRRIVCVMPRNSSKLIFGRRDIRTPDDDVRPYSSYSQSFTTQRVYICNTGEVAKILRHSAVPHTRGYRVAGAASGGGGPSINSSYRACRWPRSFCATAVLTGSCVLPSGNADPAPL